MPEENTRPVVRRYMGARGICQCPLHLGDRRQTVLVYLEEDKGELMCRDCAGRAVRRVRAHCAGILVYTMLKYDPDDKKSMAELLKHIMRRFNITAAVAVQVVEDARAYHATGTLREKVKPRRRTDEGREHKAEEA